MKFCTAVNCMDGRVQEPVIRFLTERFSADCVDMITEPGPNRILAEKKNAALLQAIEERIRISVDIHQSVGIAVAGHYDCAGNPASEEEQAGHTHKAVEHIQKRFPGIPVIGLWINENREVQEIPPF